MVGVRGGRSPLSQQFFEQTGELSFLVGGKTRDHVAERITARCENSANPCPPLSRQMERDGAQIAFNRTPLDETLLLELIKQPDRRRMRKTERRAERTVRAAFVESDQVERRSGRVRLVGVTLELALQALTDCCRQGAEQIRRSQSRHALDLDMRAAHGP